MTSHTRGTDFRDLVAPPLVPTVLDLFSAAAGGWSLGMHRAGFVTVAACEAVDWRRALFAQNNPGVKIYDDVRTLSAERLVRDLAWLPDVIVGSPPCQDISSANTKGKGVDGERSGLYFEAIRLIGECRPRWFALENSANLRTRGADRVVAAIQAIRYAVEISVVGADAVRANHERKRSWLIGFDPEQVTDARSWEQWQQSGWWHGANRASPLLHSDNDPAVDGDATQIGWRARRSGRCSVAAHGVPVETCGDAVHASSFGHEGGRTRGHRADGDGTSPAPECIGDVADAQGVRSASRPGSDIAFAQFASPPISGANGYGQSHGAINDEMGGSESAGDAFEEPWAEWNSGLAGHLRVDDGLSAQMASTRVAVGGPRGTAAASLIVEAFGDAVVPQVTEAIGRSILRTDRALREIYGRTTPALSSNDGGRHG